MADLRSMTCVVAMLTTAGSTRFTIPEKELEDGTGSGTTSGVALVPEKLSAFMADTRPETTVPIIMPAANVSATNAVAKILRLRAQPTNSFTCSPIVRLLSCWDHKPGSRSITLQFVPGCATNSVRREDYCTPCPLRTVHLAGSMRPCFRLSRVFRDDLLPCSPYL